MKSDEPLKKMRFRPTGLRISLFTQAAFIISLFLTCLCGPYCGAAVKSGFVTQESSDCCSGCPNEERQEEAPGCDCCVLEQSDFIHELITHETLTCHSTHAEPLVEWLQPQKESNMPPLCIADPSQGPPPYLRFEMLLI